MALCRPQRAYVRSAAEPHRSEPARSMSDSLATREKREGQVTSTWARVGRGFRLQPGFVRGRSWREQGGERARGSGPRLQDRVGPR